VDGALLSGLADTPLSPGLAKAPTGIAGRDAITGGGLPRDRVTLVAGGAGTGKTLLGLQFLAAAASR
jgi:circadian clock protein KaiC